MATALKPEKTSGESIGVRKLPPETPARDAQSEGISKRASNCCGGAAASGAGSARRKLEARFQLWCRRRRVRRRLGTNRAGLALRQTQNIFNRRDSGQWFLAEL